MTSNGLEADPQKIWAIIDMPTLINATETQLLLGMANCLNQFLPKLSEVVEPIRKTLKKDSVCTWTKEQSDAFEVLKQRATTAPVLGYFNVDVDVTIQCDSLQFGIGATLMQDGHPIASVSKKLTETERRYAQIEKECLAIVYACKKFDQYLCGKVIKVESDHKPLQSIFKKSIYQHHTVGENALNFATL